MIEPGRPSEVLVRRLFAEEPVDARATADFAPEHPPPAEKGPRWGLLRVLGLIVVICAVGWALLNGIPELIDTFGPVPDSSFTPISKLTNNSEGYFPFAKGSALGHAWQVEWLPGWHNGSCVRLMPGPVVEACGVKVNKKDLLWLDGAAIGGRRDTHEAVFFGIAHPRVGSIEVLVDGRPIRVHLVDPPAYLEEPVRLVVFEGVRIPAESLEVTIRNRSGQVIDHREMLNPNPA